MLTKHVERVWTLESMAVQRLAVSCGRCDASTPLAHVGLRAALAVLPGGAVSRSCGPLLLRASNRDLMSCCKLSAIKRLYYALTCVWRVIMAHCGHQSSRWAHRLAHLCTTVSMRRRLRSTASCYTAAPLVLRPRPRSRRQLSELRNERLVKWCNLEASLK